MVTGETTVPRSGARRLFVPDDSVQKRILQACKVTCELHQLHSDGLPVKLAKLLRIVGSLNVGRSQGCGKISGYGDNAVEDSCVFSCPVVLYYCCGKKATTNAICGSDCNNFECKFKSHFGMKVIACSDLWVQILRSPDIDDLEPKHLLLAFLARQRRLIDSEFGKFLLSTSRTVGSIGISIGRCAMLMVLIAEWMNVAPSDADYSHRFNKAGLQYEVASALGCSQIVLVAGGVPCSDWPDLKLARPGIIPRLEPDEKVAADKGYRRGPHFICPIDNEQSPEAVVVTQFNLRYEPLLSM
ncbi:hypothetical protein DFJ73DRAFT_960029 [Zopfochytrium polystomum]|nr:hypothetical protein DFJ73DRAFT_960029 [Zopfochytrium polystomum]